MKTTIQEINASLQDYYYVSRPRHVRCRQITLPKHSQLLRPQRPHYRMQNPMVIKQHHISLHPVMRIHILRTDRRPQQPVDDLAHVGEVVDDGARGQVDLADGGRLDLEGEVARHRVSPGHREDLDLGWVDGGEVGGGTLEVLGVET